MKPKKITVVFIFFLISIMTLSSCKESEKQSSVADSSKSAGTSNLKVYDGDTLTAEELKKNKITVLNVWATWCPPCIAELPHLQELNELYKDQGVEVIGLLHDGVDDDFKRVDKTINQGLTLLKDAKANYRIVLPNRDITMKFLTSLQAFPTTFMLNSEGEVIETYVGAKDLNGWKGAVDAALKKVG